MFECLICQSGAWKKIYKINQPRIVNSPFGNIWNGYPDAGVAWCNDDEIVVGGGGQCHDGFNGKITSLSPVKAGDTFWDGSIAFADGWFANCWANGEDTPARAIAYCIKKQ